VVPRISAKNERDVGHPALVAGMEPRNDVHSILDVWCGDGACGSQAGSITIFIEVAVGFDAIAIASTASDKGKWCETSPVRS
jgi:hypothetical protein